MPASTDSLTALFERHFGHGAESLAPLRADGSARRIFRLSGAERPVIGIVNADRRENAAFIAFSRHFRKSGLHVPEIYAEDAASGSYLEEDLGDTTLFQFLSAHRAPDAIGEPAYEAYRKVVRVLPRFQITAGKTLDYRPCYPRASFDKQSMLWDLNYFKYYFLRLAKIAFNEQDLENDFERFSDFLLAAPGDFFLYRDFQSRNVMLKDGEPFFIDYQGGRKGALQYDIASLLFDAKADLPADARRELLAEYLEAAAKLTPIDRGDFLKHYPGYVYIRIMQAMGAYGLRGFYERKSHFLQSIPYAVRNLEHLLREAPLPDGLPELTQVFKRIVGSSYLRQFGAASLKLTVRIQSFSYKGGLPNDDRGHGGGYVFDCRALPNPGRFEQYAKSTGKDPDVAAYLKKEPAVGRFLDHVFALIDHAVENYQSRNFTDLMVGFGCTGGRHRSVYCAETLAARLRDKFKVDVDLRHREQEAAESAP